MFATPQRTPNCCAGRRFLRSAGIARRLGRWLLVWLLCGSFAAAQAPEEIDPEKEYTVKAVQLYSLGLYSGWPPGHESFRIAVIGKDPFNGKLDLVAAKRKTMHDLPMVIEHPASTDAVRDCQIVFIPAGTNAQQVQEILKKLQNAPTMVVGETPDFAASGGDADLVVENGKVKLELNIKSLARKKIQPTAKLLKIATIVEETRAVTQKNAKP